MKKIKVLVCSLFLIPLLSTFTFAESWFETTTLEWDLKQYKDTNKYYMQSSEIEVISARNASTSRIYFYLDDTHFYIRRISVDYNGKKSFIYNESDEDYIDYFFFGDDKDGNLVDRFYNDDSDVYASRLYVPSGDLNHLLYDNTYNWLVEQFKSTNNRLLYICNEKYMDTGTINSYGSELRYGYFNSGNFENAYNYLLITYGKQRNTFD